MRRANTLVELVVVVALAAALFALLLPAVQRVRAAAARLQCQARLRQVALAAHLRHDLDGRFPPGTCPAADPAGFLGWLADLLPLIDQEPLARVVRADGRLPYQLLARPGIDVVVPAFTCPSDIRTATAWDVSDRLPGGRPAPVALASFLGNAGTDHRRRDGVLYLGSRVTVPMIADGTSGTLLAGERPPSADARFGWWHSGVGVGETGGLDAHLGAREVNPHARPTQHFFACPRGPHRFTGGRLDNLCDVFHFWSLHPGGAGFVFADGSYHFLRYSAADLLPALATRAGGEIAAPD